MEENEFVSKSEIKQIISTLQETDINFRNYEKIKDKIDSSRKMIIAQIQNLTRNYAKARDSITELKDKDSFKNRRDRGIVALEVFEKTNDMLESVKEAFSWKTMDVEMNAIFIERMFKLLQESKADEVNRDAVKETKNMITQLNEFYVDMIKEIIKGNKDITESKMKMLDDKIVATAKFQQSRADEQLKGVVQVMTEVLQKYGEDNKKISTMLRNIELKVGRPLDSVVQKDIFEEKEEPVFEPKKPKEDVKPDPKNDDIEDSFDDFFAQEEEDKEVKL